jgi:hypothetical protein
LGCAYEPGIFVEMKPLSMRLSVQQRCVMTISTNRTCRCYARPPRCKRTRGLLGRGRPRATHPANEPSRRGQRGEQAGTHF